MSPPDSFIYGDYLFELGLVDDVARQDLLEMEQGMKDAAASEQWREAWEVSSLTLTKSKDLGIASTCFGVRKIAKAKPCIQLKLLNDQTKIKKSYSCNESWSVLCLNAAMKVLVIVFELIN